jgi:hypothetical protein
MRGYREPIKAAALERAIIVIPAISATNGRRLLYVLRQGNLATAQGADQGFKVPAIVAPAPGR